MYKFKIIRRFISIFFTLVSFQSCLIDIPNVKPKEIDVLNLVKRTVIFDYKDISSNSTGFAYATLFPISKDSILATTGYFETFSDWSRGYLMSRASGDFGKTWGKVETFQENIGKIYTSPTSFIRMNDSTLLTFILVKETSDVCDVFQKESNNNGKSWSQPHKISLRNNVYQHFINDSAIKLESGRLIIPMCIGAYHTPPENNVFCYYSDNNGESWEMSDKIMQETHKLLEPSVVEYTPDSLLMTIRNQGGKMFFSKSYDGGLSWTNPILSEINCPDAPSKISKIPNSNLLFLVWNDVNTSQNVFQWNNRTPLSMAVSDDNGNNWIKLYNIEDNENNNFYYPSITFLNEYAFISYTIRGKNDQQSIIGLKKYPIQDLVNMFYRNKSNDAFSLLPDVALPLGNKP